MVQGNFKRQEALTNKGIRRARAYSACSRSRWDSMLYFQSPVIFLTMLTARYRLKYCLKGPSKQTLTSQPITGRS